MDGARMPDSGSAAQVHGLGIFRECPGNCAHLACSTQDLEASLAELVPDPQILLKSAPIVFDVSLASRRWLPTVLVQAIEKQRAARKAMSKGLGAVHNAHRMTRGLSAETDRCHK